MSTRAVGPRLAGSAWLLVLSLQVACATVPRTAPLGDRPIHDAAGVLLEPDAVATRPVSIERAAFQHALRGLVRDMRADGSPRLAAHDRLKTEPSSPDEVETVGMAGEWLLEADGDRTHTFVPLRQTGPVPLTPEAEESLRTGYLRWCEHQGGGDCLGLLDDGPYLRADDRRTLALALALGSVLDETREALTREVLDARALVSLVVWTAAVYCAMWAVPEPTLKAVAATLTVLLVGWLGVDTVWSLMDGWARLTRSAHDASTFEDLRAAGGAFGAVLGEDAARAMILAVATLSGRTAGELAARVRSLPGYRLAGAQWKAQGGAAVLETVEGKQESLAVAVAAVEAMAMSPQGPTAVVLLKSRGSGGHAPSGRGATTVIRHRAGNRQVELANGQRWHLPRGKSLADIPTEDKAGDVLQEAVTRAAKEWGPDGLSVAERSAIKKAVDQGKYWLARLLEREARGRYVHEAVRHQLQPGWRFNVRGVDIIDLKTGHQYELLSGTESNVARHGRRMAREFFRMIIF
ncbi:hypothetical protein [Archangium primigenium]|uniref:SitA5 family polymorphic toxin n=1 Tax=[Archangium] primigenium TaxID=2792470 RepID=UPI0030842441